MKRLTARSSLQRPKGDQILSTDKMFDFCREEIPVLARKDNACRL